MVQVVLDETVRVVREDRVLIVETRQGSVRADAGSIGRTSTGQTTSACCPSTATQARWRSMGIEALAGVRAGVVVSDTFGRAWRMGLVNVALGVAGIPAMVDYRGRPDDFGMPLQATLVAVADELAAAAELLMGKTAAFPWSSCTGSASSTAPPGTGNSWFGPRSSTSSGESCPAVGRNRKPLTTGLAGMLPPEDLSVVANTADDEEFWDLLVSRDVDAILYRLAGVFNDATGPTARRHLSRPGNAGQPS